MIRTKVIPRIPAGKIDTLAVPVVAGAKRVPSELSSVDTKTGGALGAALKSGDVRKAGAVTVVHGVGKAAIKRLLVVGVGKKASAASVRRAAGTAATEADRRGARKLVLAGFADLLGKAKSPDACRAIGDGVVTGPWLDLRYRKRRAADGDAGTLRTVEVVAPGAKNKAAVAEGTAIGNGANFARELGNAPANLMTPTALANAARAMARKRARLTVEVLSPAQMKKLKMGSLLGVAQGSAQPPRMVIAHYRGGKGAPIALVGKGVMFDTGGISLKPPPGMDKMKMDMCGGAGMLGTIQAIADMKLPINVVAVVPAVENMPGANAQRPGDIVKACNGVSIEVLNTDAEGRLILADALAYTEKRFKPKAMVDMATLTGAVVIALGRHCLGAMGTDGTLMKALLKAGETAGERAWELPLWDEHVNDARSTIADVKNIGPPRQAGTIMGAAFLRHFVKDTPWAHLDIAAVAWTEGGANPAPTGAGVRLLSQYLRTAAGRK